MWVCALGSASKVRASVSVRVAVISGFLTIPCSGLPEAAAEVKRYALKNQGYQCQNLM